VDVKARRLIAPRLFYYRCKNKNKNYKYKDEYKNQKRLKVIKEFLLICELCMLITG
tara:strand:+ start:21 stop:188 length:168 start_codon:yes stop_codon:yes gene_type:complete